MMSDENQKKYDHLSPQLAEKAEKTAIKLAAIKAARELSNKDSEWSLIQEILQEIIAGYLVIDPNAQPAATKLVENLKSEIEKRYQDEEEIKNILLESVPSARSVRQWLKKEGWEDAVWAKIRADQLFSAGKRAEVINALRQRAIDKSDLAAKIYLTLSGDYVEKQEINEKSLDTYREITKALIKNKED